MYQAPTQIFYEDFYSHVDGIVLQDHINPILTDLKLYGQFTSISVYNMTVNAIWKIMKEVCNSFQWIKDSLMKSYEGNLLFISMN